LHCTALPPPPREIHYQTTMTKIMMTTATSITTREDYSVCGNERRRFGPWCGFVTLHKSTGTRLLQSKRRTAVTKRKVAADDVGNEGVDNSLQSCDET